MFIAPVSATPTPQIGQAADFIGKALKFAGFDGTCNPTTSDEDDEDEGAFHAEWRQHFRTDGRHANFQRTSTSAYGWAHRTLDEDEKYFKSAERSADAKEVEDNDRLLDSFEKAMENRGPKSDMSR